jgi:hypothetical protein
MNQPPNPDPMQFLKSLWETMGVPAPGMVTPTLDTGEIEKRIADLKSVENWLNMNLSMLRTTIQGLEMQKATLTMMQQGMSGMTGAAGAAAKPPDAMAVNPMVEAWWNAMQGRSAQGKDDEKNEGGKK